MPSNTNASASIRREARASFACVASRRRSDAESPVRVISTAMVILPASQRMNHTLAEMGIARRVKASRRWHNLIYSMTCAIVQA